MEEEKKKKKNKKKKGKQTKTSEDVAIADAEAASPELNRVAEPKQNHHIHGCGNAVVQNAGMLELGVKTNCHQIDEVESVSSTILLEEEFRQLEAEKQSWLQREKHLEDEIKQVMLDRRSWILKEISLGEKIMLLQHEKDSSIQNEANLKEKIKLLQNENESRRQKEASLEEIIKQLQSEKDSWTIKEAYFEEKIKHLESGNVSWVLKEVKELEESRNDLLEENHRLVESMSNLEIRIQHLERDNALSAHSVLEMKHVPNEEDPSSLVEAARSLVEKLIVENAELVEKVNELYIALDRHGITAAQSSMVEFDPAMVMAGTATVPDYLSERRENMVEPNEAMQFPLSIQSKDETTVVNNVYSQSNADARIQKDELLGSFKTSESTSDIVEFSLHENEIQEVKIMPVPPEENMKLDVELHSVEAGEDAGVPLSDAPLIGAPFRLISFVAKYVSGADLVNKNSSDSVR